MHLPVDGVGGEPASSRHADQCRPTPYQLGISTLVPRRLGIVAKAPVTFDDGLWNGRSLRAWLPQVVAEVLEAVDPVRVIVFGSVARREEHSESDLDLLVVVDHLDPAGRRETMRRVRRAISAPVPVDVLVADVQEFEARRDLNGSPFYWPAREGEVVHERHTPIRVLLA